MVVVESDTFCVAYYYGLLVAYEVGKLLAQSWATRTVTRGPGICLSLSRCGFLLPYSQGCGKHPVSPTVVDLHEDTEVTSGNLHHSPGMGETYQIVIPTLWVTGSRQSSLQSVFPLCPCFLSTKQLFIKLKTAMSLVLT